MEQELPKVLTIRHIVLLREETKSDSDVVTWKLPHKAAMDISISRHGETWWSVRVGRVVCKCTSQEAACKALLEIRQALRAGLPSLIEKLQKSIHESAPRETGTAIRVVH